MDFLKRKPKNLDAAPENEGLVDGSGNIAQNAAAAKKQRLALYGLGGFMLVMGAMYVMDDDAPEEEALAASSETTISTDALMNRDKMDREWVAGYEHQINSQGSRIEAVESQVPRVMALEEEVRNLRSENAAMAQDGTRVLEAYERDNQQLRRELQEIRQRPSAPGPAASAAALGVQSPGQGGAPAIPPSRPRDVKMVSFTPASGTASRIDPANGATSYTDSPNYLPPNSIANATVVVGVDATTNTRSQSDPLPVLLRITGPARSVYGDGKLLATRVQGCMVNGAAYGDLSSEKVYVKLQRMTCAQPGGRFAVSEVKGFIAFGGKVGVRGRVVSREGSLTTQAFLAGLVSSAGSAINGAFDQPVISDSGRENPSAGEIGLRGLGGGAEQAGTTVSEYLIERAEQYQPVIEMPTGAAVEVVFLDGTFVRN
jgi:conjugal transfer pilus assembly protein TraB